MIRVGLGINFSYLGGVNYARNLLTALASLPDPKIEPVLLIGTRVDERLLGGLPPVEVIRDTLFDPFKPMWAIRKAWQQAFSCDPFLERFLRSQKIDVISHSDPLGKRSTLPSICWISDFQHLAFPQLFRKSDIWYRNRHYRLQCDLAKRIIVSSNHAQRALAAFRPSSVDKSRLLRFVAQPRITEDTPGIRMLQERYGFAGSYFHVPNQFWAHKNHALILDALAILKERGETMLVISTGETRDYRDPRFFDELMARAHTLGVQDSFKVLGVVPYGDLVGLMQNAVAIINPSRSEGWSTSVEEARSLGKLSILSDLPVHREQAPPEGRYFDPSDPTALADMMRLAWTTHDPSADRRRSEHARDELPGRVRDFAETYERIVLEASSPT